MWTCRCNTLQRCPGSHCCRDRQKGALTHLHPAAFSVVGGRWERHNYQHSEPQAPSQLLPSPLDYTLSGSWLPLKLPLTLALCAQGTPPSPFSSSTPSTSSPLGLRTCCSCCLKYLSPLNFAQLTLIHHWILNVTAVNFSLICSDWVSPSVKCGHQVCKSTHDMQAFPDTPRNILLLQPWWPRGCSSHTPSFYLRQNPCTCCPLCLQHSSPVVL